MPDGLSITLHSFGMEGGDDIRVKYAIRVVREILEVAPGQFIPGRFRIEGSLTKPDDALFTVRNVGKYFTLTLEDGRRLDFFFRDQNGTIANTGPGLY
jgi:hypothetical protein